MRIFCLLLILVSFISRSQVTIPTLTGRVVDTTNTLSDGQTRELSQLSEQLEQQTSAQLVTVLVPTTAPQTLEQFAEQTFEKWQLGQKNKDNGVLLLVALNDRAVRIEVGYGLEGQLTDLTTNQIIRHIIIPAFKEQHYYQGILTANQQLADIINGQPLATNRWHDQDTNSNSQQLTFPFGFIILFPAIGLALFPAAIAYFLSKMVITMLTLIAILPLSAKRKEAVQSWLTTFNSFKKTNKKNIQSKKKDKNQPKPLPGDTIKPFSIIKLILMCGWLSVFNYLFALLFLHEFEYSQQQFYQLLLTCVPFNLLIYRISRRLHSINGVGSGGSRGSGSSSFSSGSSRSGGGFSGGGGRSGGGGSSGRW